MTDANGLLRRAIAWTSTGDAEFPYRATVAGHTLTIRVGDFPAEHLYTLLVDDDGAAGFDTWPPRWRRPAAES